MHLRHLNCVNYRNIAECSLELSPKFNCFLGDNGMGKTNLLDAIHFLSLTKSHLASTDALLVRHGEPFMMMEGLYESEGHDERIEVTIKPKVKKQIKRNGKLYTRMADHIGLIPIVLISPIDQQIIADGSDERRRFMDIVISQCDVRYLSALSRYNSLLKNRNELLRRISEGAAVEEELLDILDSQMSVEAAYIYAKRADFIAKFVPFFDSAYSEICSSREAVHLQYVSQLERGELEPLLSECRLRDKAIGYTTRGVHKDDLLLAIDGYPLKNTGSQGQTKSVVVAMKLAQYQLLGQMRRVKPILLLDDVFDRLDSTRVGNIIRMVSRDDFGQIFITDTSRNHIDTLLHQTVNAPFSIFTVHDGVISENASVQKS